MRVLLPISALFLTTIAQAQSFTNSGIFSQLNPVHANGEPEKKHCSRMKFEEKDDQSFLVLENKCELLLKWNLCSNSYDHALIEYSDGIVSSPDIVWIPYNSNGEQNTIGMKRCLGENCIPETPKCELLEKGSKFMRIEL